MNINCSHNNTANQTTFSLLEDLPVGCYLLPFRWRLHVYIAYNRNEQELKLVYRKKKKKDFGRLNFLPSLCLQSGFFPCLDLPLSLKSVSACFNDVLLSWVLVHSLSLKLSLKRNLSFSIDGVGARYIYIKCSWDSFLSINARDCFRLRFKVKECVDTAL